MQLRWELCRHSGRVTLTVEIISLLLCFLVAAGQHAYLDHLLITNTNPATFGFLAGDILVAICMVATVVHFALFYRKTRRGKSTKSPINIRFGYVMWLLYASLTAAKIIFASYKLPNNVTLNQAYRLSLCISALVFLLFVMSYHFNQMDHHLHTYLSFLVSTVTLDICDSVQILDLLYQTHVIPVMATVKVVTLVLVTINFILPTAALFDLQLRRFPFTRVPLDKIYTLGYILVVNVPYLCLRLYVWALDPHTETITTPESGVIFLVKNVIMIIVATRDIWMSCLYQPEDMLSSISTISVNRKKSSDSMAEPPTKNLYEMIEIDHIQPQTSVNPAYNEPQDSF